MRKNIVADGVGLEHRPAATALFNDLSIPRRVGGINQIVDGLGKIGIGYA